MTSNDPAVISNNNTDNDPVVHSEHTPPPPEKKRKPRAPKKSANVVVDGPKKDEDKGKVKEKKPTGEKKSTGCAVGTTTHVQRDYTVVASKETRQIWISHIHHDIDTIKLLIDNPVAAELQAMQYVVRKYRRIKSSIERESNTVKLIAENKICDSSVPPQSLVDQLDLADAEKIQQTLASHFCRLHRMKADIYERMKVQCFEKTKIDANIFDDFVLSLSDSFFCEPNTQMFK